MARNSLGSFVVRTTVGTVKLAINAAKKLYEALKELFTPEPQFADVKAPEKPAFSMDAEKVKETQMFISQEPKSTRDRDIIRLLKRGETIEDIKKAGVDITPFLKARAQQIEMLEHNELTFVPRAHKGEKSQEAFDRSIIAEQASGAILIANLQQYPDAAKVFNDELLRCQEARQKFTPQELEFRKLQQDILKAPYRNFDKSIANLIRDHYASEFDKHINVFHYLQRRAVWAEAALAREAAATPEAPLNEKAEKAAKDAKAFLKMMEFSPVATNFIKTNMEQARIEREARPENKYAYDMSPPEQQKNLPEPAQERSKELNAPVFEGPEIG